MGLLLGGLAGLNLAVALLGRRARRACRLRGLPGLLGAAPALFAGATCCVPTLALALGAQFTLCCLPSATGCSPRPGRDRDLAAVSAQQAPAPP
jgi:hypothetical protein